MKATRILATTFALLLAPCVLSFAADAPAAAAPLNATVESAVANGIKLLEAKDYKTFLKTYVPPEVYPKIIADKGEDAFVAMFAGDKATKLLAVLKSIKDAKPTMKDDGKTAVYDLAEEIADKKNIQFVQVNGAWYIRN